MPYYVYIMTNYNNTVTYTGVTNDLQRRVNEHKSGKIAGFTKRYKIKKLIYAEKLESIKTAIIREKQIKNLSRIRKKAMIDFVNPEWEEIQPF